MADAAIPPDIAQMSFEDALQELELIVRGLENGKGKLEDSIESYERGAALKAHCEARLREAKAKVDKITIGPDGSVESEAADLD
ncbi:MAG: exodeoxyribonuclease VII small subunit [Alphaproteobacteria bacterium]|nr:exodeoxyribonuclease VII small subunit [Alphaproteobacteria bacterium]